MTDSVTTVQLNKSVVNALKEIRKYPRQTYNELISDLIKFRKKAGLRNQYDEFLHKIQQPKMGELWGSKEDEDWDNV